MSLKSTTSSNRRPREGPLVQRVLTRLRELGAFAEKIHGEGSQPILPDILACYRGYFLAIECKRDEKEATTPRQQYVLNQIEGAGGYAFKVYEVGQVNWILETIDAAIRGD